MKAATKKMKKKKTVLDVQLSTDKRARNNARPPDTAKLDEKQDCQFWILRLFVFTRFPANRDCLLKLYMLVSGESRMIFLPERSSICQYRPEISAIIVKTQSRARLVLAHPVLYIVKTQKMYCTTISKSTKKRYRLRSVTCTTSASGSGNATWVNPSTVFRTPRG